MSLPVDIARVMQMALAMDLHPDFLRQAIQEAMTDPEQARRILEQPAQSMNNQPASVTKPSVDISAREDFVQKAKRFKEINERERSLPPSRAPPLSKSSLVVELERHRRQFREAGVEKQITTTYIGLPKDFSSTSVTDLEPIVLTDMQVRKRHTGHYLICRVVARPTRSVAFMLGVEDCAGSVARLCVYNYPGLHDACLDYLDALFPLGTAMLVREPTYKMNVQGIYAMIRVDSPSDLTVLEPDDPIIKELSWQCTAGSFKSSLSKSPSTADGWRVRGASEFKEQRWLSAAVCYTKGLKLDRDSQILRLNRAETYLRLGWYFSSLHDTEQALRLGTIADATLGRKAVVRSIKANYGLGNYNRVIQIAGEHPRDDDCKDWLSKARKRIAEQTCGDYDWCALFMDNDEPNARIDVADFRGPVEVRECERRPGQRGVFVTRDVDIGELLMVAHPLASCFQSDTICKNDSFVSYNFLTNKIETPTQSLVITRLVQRLWDDMQANATLQVMYAGPSCGYTSFPPPAVEQHPLEHPLKPVVDIDIAHLEAVASMNNFGVCKEISFDYSDEAVRHRDDRGTALYALPSSCNHACLPTATRAMAGDVMVVRAAQCLKAGDEVTLCYVPYEMPYDERMEKLSKWGFACDCQLCCADSADGQTAREERARLFQKARYIMKEFSKCIQPVSLRERTKFFNQMRKVLTSTEKTYKDSDSRRSCAARPGLHMVSTMLSSIVSSSYAPTPAYVEQNITVEMGVLENAGITIKDKNMRAPTIDMPLDIRRSYCATGLYHRCVMSCLRIASLASQLGQQGRTKAWVDAARTIFSAYFGDCPKLFERRYAKALEVEGLVELIRQ